MNRRLPFAAMAIALSLSATTPSVYAAPLFGRHADAPQATAKVKTVGFLIRNDSANALTLQAGEKQMMLHAGETASLKLPVGTQVVTIGATSHLAAGAVITTVNDELKGNTLVIS